LSYKVNRTIDLLVTVTAVVTILYNQVDVDSETGQMILRGMGELHLEVIQHRLQRDHGVQPYLGPLEVQYSVVAVATHSVWC